LEPRKISIFGDRPRGKQLESDLDTADLVSRRWAEYGLPDLNLDEVDPNLFGYDMH
jgi:4-hydroxy-3-polyprenylbenzoate decarboxylase